MGKSASHKTNTLRPVQGYAQMREFRSQAEWFSVEFLVYYERSQIKTFAYVRLRDGMDIADGDYEVVEEEEGRRRRWKKWNGKWQVKWRHRWGRQRQ